MQKLSKAPVENVLQLSTLKSTSPDTFIFTNTYPIWHPPDARGIYGGICIAQSLNAAQATVPRYFCPQSIHSQFVRAGNADSALRYHVDQVNNGRSFASRLVKVTQESQTIFIAIVNFAREWTATQKTMEHAEPMPQRVPRPPEEYLSAQQNHTRAELSPYLTWKVGLFNAESPYACEKRVYQWSRARGKISTAGGVHAHNAALAYICDNYMIGSIPHVHGVWNFVKPPLTEFDICDRRPNPGLSDSQYTFIPSSTPRSQDPHEEKNRDDRRIGMMVTLSHNMFFHNPAAVQADEWMLSELSSHWASQGRGVATQKIWTASGALIATCVQEAVVRLAEPEQLVRACRTSRI